MSPLLCVLAGLCLTGVAAADDTPVYADVQAPLEVRVSDLLARLSLEEKVNLCHGNFVSGGVPRLGIGQLMMLDGRQGLRPVRAKKGTRATSLPCALALSCTWDEEAARRFGRVLAEEMLALDRHVLLGPMLNLVRSPLGGRNFENFGEDPFLVGSIGAAYIEGIQELGVGACSCLLVANDCETRRHYTSSNMDERTLRELHLQGYEMSVRRAGVWTMMSGNNLFNGKYCAQDRRLIQELMKDQIGFDGVMITDWRAAYDPITTALAGTDMTTGLCSYVFGDGRLLAAVQSGGVPLSLLDEKVRRILRLYIRAGVLNPESRARGGLDTPEHRQAARGLAAQGMVLLKNDRNLLPLEPARQPRILITGPGADTVIQGGGSGHVPAAISITPLQGLKSALAGQARITHLPYTVAEASQRPDRRGGGTAADDQIPESASLVKAAKAADVVIFVAAGTLASESHDLPDMNLPGNQAQAITALADANPDVIVVAVNNGAFSLDGWADKVPAILAIHYSGQATGDALADVLTGKVNPSGKLSYTFAKRLDDYPCHALGEWPARLILDKDPGPPGIKPEDRAETHAYDAEYKEGVFAGYRWFDQKKIEPAFPFGHGLSYTSFELSDVAVTHSDASEGSPAGEGATEGLPAGKGATGGLPASALQPEYIVTCTVKNIGEREGAEVVQVYVSPPESSVPRPPRELRGFAKVNLKPGESRLVRIPIGPRALAFFDVDSGKWKAEAGEYQILVGTSSRDIRQESRITLSQARYCD